MCIAIVTKPGFSVGDKELYRGWSGNKDGGGFAFVHDGKVQIKKGYMTYNEFQKAYRAAVEQYGRDSHFLVHMRIGTSGGVTPNNTHPFAIKGGAMIHNGVLFYPTGKRAGPPGDRKSDTRVFAESLYNILQLEDIKKAEQNLRRAVGGNNKLCFLYDDNSYFILGEDLGFWREGVWYSNYSCVGYTDDRSSGGSCSSDGIDRTGLRV